MICGKSQMNKSVIVVSHLQFRQRLKTNTFRLRFDDDLMQHYLFI